MEILAWIMVGLVVGWMTGVLFKSEGFWANLLLGVAGALASGFLSGASLKTGIDPLNGFNLLPLALPVLGAIVPVALLHVIQRSLAVRSADLSDCQE